MAKLYNAVHRIWTDARGQDLLEYALIAGFVAVAAGAIFPTTLMPSVSVIFSKIGVLFVQAASQGS
jgi:Flp pilus assembly pilin Flp